MTKVTIITPTYNTKLEELDRCLDSVQRQTYRDFEQIICTDGPPDPVVAAAIANRNDPRLRYRWTTDHYGGWGHAVRRAMMLVAGGDYLCFLDDDNIIFPTYLDKMLTALGGSHPDCAFAICAIVHYGPVIPELGRTPIVLMGEPKAQLIDTLQVVVERQAMRAVGWLGNDYISDGHNYERLGRAYNFVRVPEVLGIHH